VKLPRGLPDTIHPAILQFGIETSAFEQFFVLALFNDVAVAHYPDQIRVADGGQTRGDDEASAADYQAEQTKNKPRGIPHPILNRVKRWRLRKSHFVEEMELDIRMEWGRILKFVLPRIILPYESGNQVLLRFR